MLLTNFCTTPFPWFVAALVAAVGVPYVAGYFLASRTPALVGASAFEHFEVAVADSFSAPAAFVGPVSLHPLRHPADEDGLQLLIT